MTIRGIQLLGSHLEGRGGGGAEVHQNANVYEQGEGEMSHQCERSHANFLIVYLARKILTTVTRFFLKFLISFVPKIKHQLRSLQTINLKRVSHLIALSGCFRI